MQFEYNSDYPGLIGQGQFIGAEARDPLEFPAVQPLPCARLTTRIYHRERIATVENVIVRTVINPSRRKRRGSQSSNSSSDGFMSSSSSSEEDDSMADDDISITADPREERAYWVQRTVREAIYGRVLLAIVLRRRYAGDNADWESTNERCAIKEMAWQHIRRERDRLAEDPIKEVAAMQYIKDFYEQSIADDQPQHFVTKSFRSMLATNIMTPLDLLSDDRFLYSVMPFCEGGELFERLDLNEKFSEPEARYWMLQVLNGIANLQRTGVCHRDMSLENLLVHESGALIIDLGMCLHIPIQETQSLSAQMQNMTMNAATANGAYYNSIPKSAYNAKPMRYLIRPQGTCGKWIYMSPEIYKNQEPFDGHAVDMWAAGVILFLMLTGFPPWERACMTDERFKYMTAGYLVQMLTEWNLGLSSDAMDLLQRMLFLDPKDRLSLEQVLAHPWMLQPVPTPQQMIGGGGGFI
ncbi:hypothetical protein FisN_5Hh058 [Fistulifera solaris]|uniref:Protein kinase domain-containing protein n=1 Tax=Fistulifera solaris TaxID=1519565 RepID=A0A1Z5JTQ8_FISSO|nr:hypothetical protein FisN_5Hh058 [Fistulifera solaris]|eukprot:GAX17413.1 hypothetical protein FisN_5Hh058 [Fistulifera solaris]